MKKIYMKSSIALYDMIIRNVCVESVKGILKKCETRQAFFLLCPVTYGKTVA